MARWTAKGMGITDVTDVPTDVEVVAPDEVRDFVAAHGGRLYVWISVHRGGGCALCLLETSLEHPARRDLYFRRVAAPGFDLYLEATQRIWPKRWSSPCAGAGASRPTGTAWPGSLEPRAGGHDAAGRGILRRQWMLARQRTSRGRRSWS